MIEQIIGIRVSKLKKSFGEIEALKSISLELEKGHVYLLLGPNGAGKSTFVRLLSGVMKPNEGNAEIYGYDLLNQVTEVKRITGLLPEEYALYEKLSVFEYADFIASLYDMSEERITHQFKTLSKALGMYELRDRLIETLSKGQKQKVALLTALIHEPQVLFLDEPISNLDVHAQKVVKNMIRFYQEDQRIILIATHLLSNIEDVCSRVIMIDQGKILGTYDLEEFRGASKSLEDAYIAHLERE